MPHRVLLDFTHSADTSIDELHEKIARVLVKRAGWESAHSSEQQDIFDKMAAQLPANDLASFVQNVQSAMQLKAPAAYLTIGCYTDWEVGKVRIRIASRSEAVLAELAQDIATLLLRKFADFRLVRMALFQGGKRDTLMPGKEVKEPAYRFWARGNLPVSVPLIVSVCVLAVGGLVCGFWSVTATMKIWGDSLRVWYGRLFGPMLMAIMTLGSTVARDWWRSKGAPSRSAQWIIGGHSADSGMTSIDWS